MMGKQLDLIVSKGLTRRSFVTLAAGAATLTAVGMAGCSSQNQSKVDMSGYDGTLVDLEDGAKWVTAACWHNCGGRCLNKALVKDGVVLRQGTDTNHEDTPDFPQQRACQRGRSQRMQVFGVDRLKYPMKRKNWSPEAPRGELRGKDEWERISWDEAFSLVAGQIKSISEKYTPEAIFSCGGSDLQRVFQLAGGYTPRWGSVSWGSWPDTYNLTMGSPGYSSDAPDRLTMRKQKLIILWGCNPANSSAGNPTYNYLQAKKAGAKFISIEPRYNETAEALGAEWIPIRPATDTAMVLGMIHHIVSNNKQDQEYLDKYTVGFDSDHMPSSDWEFEYQGSSRPKWKYTGVPVDPAHNFKDYVLGQGKFAASGSRDAEWASNICGVPAERIRSLADEYLVAKPATIVTGGAPARINNGDCFPHALCTLGMVAGQIGRDGGSVSATMHSSASNGGDNLVSSGGAGLQVKLPANPFSTNDAYGINQGEMWDAILNGSYTMYKDTPRTVDIHMISSGAEGSLNQRVGATLGIEAYRKVDFVLSVNYVLNPSSAFADVVLPATTMWERPGTLLTGNREILIYAQQVCDSLYEAKSDQEISEGLAVALGFKKEDIYDLDEQQQLFNKLAGSTYIDEAGEKKPLLTITAADVSAMGVTGEPQEGKISLAEFEEKGIYQVERKDGDSYTFMPFKSFIDDPLANPVKTPSGKFEIYCSVLSQHVDRIGFDHKDPLPMYTRVANGYEDGLENGYPVQITNHHYQRRSHHTFDNVQWLREAWPQELWINVEDAKKIGVSNNDIVLVENEYGKVIRPAFVTNRIYPGVISLGEGAWLQPNAEGVDEAGATNSLTAPLATGHGYSGYNSNNSRISKYSGTLKPDIEWAQRIPIA